MILAIIERYENTGEESFNERYYLAKYFKDIFEKLDILLFPIVSDNNLNKVAQLCDGLIVTGSCIDINPKYYGQEPEENLKYSEIDEFKLDYEIINLFKNEGKPILGICAGMQSINVTFGGTLYQDIKNHNLKNLKHDIKIESNSFLYNTYICEKLSVNSFHHQAIDIVAKDFKVTARSEDGIIEAIENDDIIGVQWHPEKMEDIKFFESFLEKCKSKTAT